MPEDSYLEQALKRWVTKTPPPSGGRARLLWTAAQIARPKSLTLSWMDKPGVQSPLDYYYASFGWAILNIAHPSLSGPHLNL